MADPNALIDIAKFAGGGVTGAALLYGVGQFAGGLFKSWSSGTGEQEKDLRGGLAERVEVLEKRLDVVETALSERTRERDAWRWLCMMARLAAEELARAAGVAAPVWPLDPDSKPPGGTP